MIKDDSLDDGRWFVDDTDCNSECNDDDDDHKDDDYEKRVLSRKQFLAVFFFAMHHCSVSRSSWSFKRQALTEVTRHARWVMKSLFSCNLVPRFFESRWTKARQRKIEFACSLTFIPFFRSWAHLSTYIPWQRLKQRYAQGLKNVITAPEALPLWYFKEIWIKLKNQYLHQFQIWNNKKSMLQTR